MSKLKTCVLLLSCILLLSYVTAVVSAKGKRLKANVHWDPSSHVWDMPTPNPWNAEVSIKKHDARVEIDPATIKLEKKYSPSAPPYPGSGTVLVVPFNGYDVKQALWDKLPKENGGALPGLYRVQLEITGSLKPEYGGYFFRGRGTIRVVIPEPHPP